MAVRREQEFQRISDDFYAVAVKYFEKGYGYVEILGAMDVARIGIEDHMRASRFVDRGDAR